jgi:apolipoprotein N-acyltransferase
VRDRVLQRGQYAGALALGALSALTFAPDPLPSAVLPWFQIIGLAFLVHLVWRTQTASQAALIGGLFGFAQFAVGLYWLTISMHVYGHMPLPLAVLALLLFAAYLAVFPALASWLARSLTRRDEAPTPLSIVSQASLWASAWTLMEWLRGTLFTGFPWLATAYGQLEGWLAGWASIGGTYAVTFVTAWIAAATAITLAVQAKQPGSQFTPKRGMALAMAILLAFAGAFLEQINFTRATGESLTVRLVQGNIDQGQKFTPQTFEQAMTHHLALAQHRGAERNILSSQPNLIVLPETVITQFPQQVPASMWQAWTRLATEQQATILLGSPLYDTRTGQYTNSVIAITPDTDWRDLAASQPKYHYDKHHLVPFGEFVPWGFRWFVDMMQIPLGDFTAGGPNQAAFLVGEQRVAANICYEDIFGQELLPAVRSGATILANFSNLGWFADSWALRQHWQMAKLRAIETQRPMIRSTNTGITGAISESGQTIARLPTAVAGYVDVQVQGREGLTPYARWGNYPVLGLIGLILLMTIFRRVLR